MPDGGPTFLRTYLSRPSDALATRFEPDRIARLFHRFRETDEQVPSTWLPKFSIAPLIVRFPRLTRDGTCHLLVAGILARGAWRSPAVFVPGWQHRHRVERSFEVDI